jgi:hypothetical protein
VERVDGREIERAASALVLGLALGAILLLVGRRPSRP